MTSFAYIVFQSLLIATLALRPLWAPWVNRMLSDGGYQVVGLGILGAIGIQVLLLLGILVRVFIWRRPRQSQFVGAGLLLSNLVMLALVLLL